MAISEKRVCGFKKERKSDEDGKENVISLHIMNAKMSNMMTTRPYIASNARIIDDYKEKHVNDTAHEMTWFRSQCAWWTT